MASKESLPYIHNPTSTNYAEAQAAQAEQQAKLAAVTVKIPDGRRNSVGEALPSPVETWKPNFGRQQSWNQQDQKRVIVLRRLEEEVKKGESKGGFTEGKGGFTEGKRE